MSLTFAYQGINDLGKQVRGEVTAEDLQSATALLKSRAIFPTNIAPAVARQSTAPTGGRTSGGGFGHNFAMDIAIFTRQLASLVAGGVPLMSAFAALSAHSENPRLRVILERMQGDVHGGKTLGEALAAHPTAFPPLYVSMVRAGESSGQLAAVLDWLAEYQEKEQTRRMQIRSALAYPTLLAIAGAVAIFLLIMLVVPKFSVMFTEFHQTLPLPTIMLLNTAGFLGHWGWVMLVVAIFVWTGFKRYANTSAGKLHVDGWRLRIPFFNKLLVRAAMSRFARTTATLLQGGVPLMDALAVVRDVLDNEVLAKATDHAREGMREGERFGERLQQTGVFPGFLTHMIGIGEETGDLRSMLLTVANTYDIEVESTLKSLVSLIEPVIIITVGGIIGFIIFSMLLPIFSLNIS